MSRRISSPHSTEILQAERDIRARLRHEPFNFTAMSAIANLYRGGASVRRHMERTVLADHDLSWAAFTVLWVLWIWGPQETAHVADEAGLAKATLTGVARTLEGRRLIRRNTHRADRRRVTLSLTTTGRRLIEAVFPEFNRHEAMSLTTLTTTEQRELARLLRKLIHQVEALDEP